MTGEKPRTLLIVEDDLALQKQLRWSFDKFEALTANDRESALSQVHRHNPAVVTMDLGLPPHADSVSEGFLLLEQILAIAPDTKVIVLTGQNDQANALRAIALGAYDFFAKPFEPQLMILTIDRAFRLFDLQQENRRLQALQQPAALAGLLTRDSEMLRTCRMIEKVANTNATVLLLGESGTGKEVLARGLHEASTRKGERFVAINCAAIPANLMESELFGYEKGAFTGAGKTTIVNLLMRFYDVHSGSIEVDGIDLKQYQRSEVRKLFGMVLQDTWLFQGSMRQNIAYSSLGQQQEVDMERIKQITKEAHIDHFIMSQPQGYETCLNENADNISNGQKQLLTIARAMYENSPMLILDEATSSVDTRSEILIQRAMAHLMKDRTSFIIAHRLSTIRDADLILVMKEGEIVEMGNHEQLMQQAGFYQELYNSQFEE